MAVLLLGHVFRRWHMTSRSINSVLLVVLGLCVFGASRAAAKGRFVVDPVHSFVLFRVGHLGVGHVWGWFRKFEGTIELDKDRPSNSSVVFTLYPDSVWTGDQKRDKHLKGPDFFNVRQAPRWTFKSSSVRRVGESTYEVQGTLRIRNVERPLTVTLRLVGEGKDPWGNYRAGWSARFSVNRMDFGITFMPNGIGKKVEVLVDVEAIKE